MKDDYQNVLEQRSHEEDYANAMADRADIKNKIEKENLSGDVVNVSTNFLQKLNDEFLKISTYIWRDGYEKDHNRILKSISSQYSTLEIAYDSYKNYEKTILFQTGYQNILNEIYYLKENIVYRIDQLKVNLDNYRDTLFTVSTEFETRMANYLNLIAPDKTITLKSSVKLDHSQNDNFYKEKLATIEGEIKDWTEKINKKIVSKS